MKKSISLCFLLVQLALLASCVSVNDRKRDTENTSSDSVTGNPLPLSFADISPEATLFSPSKSIRDIKNSLGSTVLMEIGRLSWPLKKFRFVRGFKPNGVGEEKHLGVDLAAPLGTEVYASRSGFVIYSGDDFSGFGKIVVLGHNEGELATLYSHLSEFDVSEGDQVKKGDLIGRVGSTGRSTGNHLHFEVRSKKRGVLDPMILLKN